MICVVNDAQCEVDPPALAQQRRGAGPDPVHAMMDEPGLSAHYHDIARVQPDRLRGTAPTQIADPEERVVAERNRHHRPPKIGLVAVLMQAHSRALSVIVDQTALWQPPASDKLAPQRQHPRRDLGPWLAIGVMAHIAIAALIGKPAILAGRCHAHAHAFAVWRHRRKEGRPRHHLAQIRHHRLLRLHVQRPAPDLHAADRQVRPCHGKFLQTPPFSAVAVGC